MIGKFSTENVLWIVFPFLLFGPKCGGGGEGGGRRPFLGLPECGVTIIPDS